MYNETSQPPELYFGWGPSLYGSNLVPEYKGPSLLGAEFVRGRVCQGPSLLGAEMSRNRTKHHKVPQCRTRYSSGVETGHRQYSSSRNYY